MTGLVYDPIDFTNYPAAWENRWEFLRYFIDCWFAPLQLTDGYSIRALQHLERQLGCQLPEAICVVLQHCGCRRDIWQSVFDNHTLFQRMLRAKNVIVINTVIPVYAFKIDDPSIDPELHQWQGNCSGDPVGKLSDVLFTEIIGGLWNGKGRERIPHFTKCVRLEPEEVAIGPNGEWLQEVEVASCMVRSPNLEIPSISYHSRDLVVATRYPNSFCVAARTTAALEVLPAWLRSMLATEPDVLDAYDFYRKQGIDKPFEPTDSAE